VDNNDATFINNNTEEKDIKENINNQSIQSQNIPHLDNEQVENNNATFTNNNTEEKDIKENTTNESVQIENIPHLSNHQVDNNKNIILSNNITDYTIHDSIQKEFLIKNTEKNTKSVIIITNMLNDVELKQSVIQNESEERKKKKILNNAQTAIITSNGFMSLFLCESKATNSETKPECGLKTYSNFVKKDEFTQQ